MSVSTLLQISCKVSMLFLPLSAQRCQTLHTLDLSDIKFVNDKLVIAPSKLLKQTKPGKHLEPLTFKRYTNEKLCIVNILSDYLERTRDIRMTEKLLISTIKLFGPVSKSTIFRWVTQILTKPGIDMAFKPHSTRSAAASTANLHGIPVDTIMKTAGWSNANFFAKFYNKPVQRETITIQDAILSVH